MIAEYDCRPIDRSIHRTTASGTRAMDRPSSIGGGRDGRKDGKVEKIDSPEVVGTRSE